MTVATTQAFQEFSEWMSQPNYVKFFEGGFELNRELAEPERSRFISEMVELYRQNRRKGTQAGQQFYLLSVLEHIGAEPALELVDQELRELRDPSWRYEHAPYRMNDVLIEFDEPLSQRLRAEFTLQLITQRARLGGGAGGDVAEILSCADVLLDNEDWRRPDCRLVFLALRTVGIAKVHGEEVIEVARKMSKRPDMQNVGYEIWTSVLGVAPGSRLGKVEAKGGVPDDILAEAANTARRHLG